MEAEKSDVCMWLFILILLPQTNCLPTDKLDDQTSCESPVITVVAVVQSDEGVSISAAPAVADNVEGVVITDLPNVAVPEQECGVDYRRCPLECTRGFDDLLCPIPVRNGTQNYLVLVELEHTSNPDSLREKKLVYVPPESACVPLQVFDRGSGVSLRYFVPCLDTTSDQPFLYFEQFKLETDLSSSTLAFNPLISKTFIRIDEGNISPLLYHDDADTACSPAQNVFMKVGSRVVLFRLFSDNAVFHLDANPIKNCSNTEGFTAFQPDRLRIECSPNDVAIYEPCSSESVVERYDTTVNATVYQCAAAAVNVYHFLGNLTVVPYGSVVDDVIDDIMLPFNDTADAQCVSGESPILFVSRGNGETFFVELSTGELHFVASNTCGPASCLNLNVLEMSSGVIVGVFDYSSNTYVLLNLTCPGSPILSRTHYPDPPILFTLVPTKNTRPCPLCNTATPPPPSSDPTNESTTQPSDTDHTDEEPPVSVDRPVGLDASSDDRTAVIAAPSAVMALLIIVAVIMVIVVYRFRGQSFTPTQSDTNSHDICPITTVDIPCQSDDPQQRDLVAETNLQDRIRITAAQTADNLAQRTKREDDANNMQQKMAAVP
jgi:hypothetical protein